MYEKSAFVFYITLFLYLVTLFTVSYVGVYLTYIAIPIIAFSGLVMLIAKPSKRTKKQSKKIKNASQSTFEDMKKVFGTWDEAKEALYGKDYNKSKKHQPSFNSKKNKQVEDMIYEDVENEKSLEELRNKEERG